MYLLFAIFYFLGLALSYFVMKERKSGPKDPLNRIAVLVPAHNEEILIGNLCKSLLKVDYPKEKYVIFIVADNCSDRTAQICLEYGVQVFQRYSPEDSGKGQALAWGLNKISLEEFDALFVIDADNYVDPSIFRELNCQLNKGETAIQCYNSVGNRNDSLLTQLLYVSRTVGNLLYHEAKYRLGLSSYLMGNGLCFKTELLQRKGWTAFTFGEDWEYYAQLAEDNIKIGFAAKAKVFHQESRSLNQATSQRLRWSSGRFHIAKSYGIRLLVRGVRELNYQKFDASLALIFPNYSLQVNLTLVALVLAVLLPSSSAKYFLIYTDIFLLAGQFMLFLGGAFIVGSPWKIACAILYSPVFLVWKGVIDILCFAGIYREKKWIRTRRHQSK